MAATTFTRFLELPDELQLLVWGFAATQPQEFHIRARPLPVGLAQTRCQLVHHYSVPGFLHACSLARTFGLEWYFYTNFDRRIHSRIFYNPDIDWLIFPQQEDFLWFAPQYMNIWNDDISLISIGTNGNLDARRLLAEELTSFADLEHVELRITPDGNGPDVTYGQIRSHLQYRLYQRLGRLKWANRPVEQTSMTLAEYMVAEPPILPGISVI